MRRAPTAVAAALLLVVTACGGDAEEAAPTPAPGDRPSAPSPTASPSEGSASPDPSPSRRSPVRPRVVGTAATGLTAPWGIDFLPDGTALVTERDTKRVLAIGDDDVRVVGTVDQASPQGEAGLLGLAVSPTYAEDSLVYVYVSTDEDNRVVSYEYDGDSLSSPQVILDGIPNGFTHDGGRLEFAPDGNLIVSTGEAGEPPLAQDDGSLGGKILRITPDGDPAPGNPGSGSPVWTTGHRNVQGLAFDDQERLWASEFGDSTWDELNLIEAGENYGWPQVEGRGDLDEFQNPVRQWATEEASPSGLAYHEGSLWMASLRGQRLWQVPVREDGSTGTPRAHFVGNYGRLRTVVVAPDGDLWLTTSNRDGRGEPAGRDDRILIVRLR